MAGGDHATQKMSPCQGWEAGRGAVEGLTEKVEQQPGGSEGHFVDECSGQRAKQCKGPEAGACAGCWRRPLWVEKIEEEQTRRRRGPGRGWTRMCAPRRSFQGLCLLL